MQWIIDWNQSTGQMKISGPIDNLILTLGALEMAKEVAKQNQFQRTSKLVAVNGKLPTPTEKA